MATFFGQFGDFSQTFTQAAQAVSSAVGQVQATNHHQSVANEELRVGKYQVTVKELLAEGGFGLIELVVEPHSQGEFALKRCNIDRPEAHKTVQKEINILQRFRGPYIVNLLDYAIQQKRTGSQEALLLMEYYPGGHLLDRINQRQGHPLPAESVFRIFGQILLAVNSMHTNVPPIIHRDIKLENVLFGPDGKVRLCDFGSCLESPIYCRNMSEKEVAETSIARETTPMYRAPEMADIHMRECLTEKTDVWALGCVFYALCFLRHPFQDKGNLAIVSASYTVPAQSTMPPDAIVFLKRMLDIDPEARPSVSELIAQLVEMAAGRPLPEYTLSEEALRRRQEREAKNVVRSESRKKTLAPAVPPRKGAPPAANSAAAKRLAAKKGEQNIVTSAPSSRKEAAFFDNSNNSHQNNEVSFAANFEQMSVGAGANTGFAAAEFDPFAAPSTSSASVFDPFAAPSSSSAAAFVPEEDFFSSSTPHIHNNNTVSAFTSQSFDPFADDAPSVSAPAQSSQPLRQPSFSSHTQSHSRAAAPSALSALFPAAEEDSHFSLPPAPAHDIDSFASHDDGFSPVSAEFDPFAAPAPVSASAVRKPSFGDFNPSKSTHDDFHMVEGVFDPFSSSATSSTVHTHSQVHTHAQQAALDIFSSSTPVSATAVPVAPQRGSFAAELLDPLPPVQTLVPQPSVSVPAHNTHTQSSLLDDILSPSVSASAPSSSSSSSFTADLLSVSDVAPSPSASRRKSALRSPDDLLSLYDQPAQPAGSARGASISAAFAPAPAMAMRSAAVPQNPFAPRPATHNTMNMNVNMNNSNAMSSFSSTPPVNAFNSAGRSAPSTYNANVNSAKRGGGGDPFDSLNVLSK